MASHIVLEESESGIYEYIFAAIEAWNEYIAFNYIVYFNNAHAVHFHRLRLRVRR